MKSIVALLFFLFLLSSLASAQKKQAVPNYILRGTFTGKHSHALFLDYKDNNGKKIRRKAYIKEDKFTFKGWISSPVYATLMSDIKVMPNNKYDVSNGTEIFLSPGEMTVSLHENDFEHAKITGSQMQDDWDELIKQEKPIQQNKLSLYNKSWKISAGGNTPKNHAAVVAIGGKIDSCDELVKQMDYRFAFTHPNSYLSAYLVNNYIEELPLDTIERYYNTFSSSVKNSIAGLSIQKEYTYRKASARGSIAPLFTKTDINGHPFNLQSFKDKNYVMLIFWASWCQCDDYQHLNQLYAKYHTKGLEIVGICTDFVTPGWKDTINKHGTKNWHHIAENMGTSKYNNILEVMYNINGMPPSTIFLIDKKGKIIGRYYGSIQQDFERRIDEGTLNDLDKKLAQVIPNN
ncbi:Glutathione peroxidase, house-cleaning role in reducing lipid peroxides [Mucilaginibacter mallensis]|uniref:Glutathione peroxidase, house-cleaning role in reducing lipid peroxides n=1 Tax=Mucilaginibacter mallensis TaxID=652787 RepID=A0A1H2B5D2_MUCMA|nr:TlpA disulfide reductase family protein [Mucilaginibacter mallensis]SDT53411.1 Glutathione peroxidase, house-cleaning role in reducing lipid peroxides [Mucilaginibacter mallensis]